ncbi:MAG: cadherin-like beta sandwich domain-containing protein [Eubacteriales bacterium]|nr:cadherin-like beta sandwich domain-containing protein [Eubacteriales bacterium]
MSKKIKKILLSICATLSLSIVFAFNSFAAGSAKIEFSDLTITRGKTINVMLKVKATGVRLSRADITVVYDQNALEFVPAKDAQGAAGMIRVQGKGQGVSSSILEYELKFNTLVAGKHTLSIQSQEVYDVNDQLVEITKLGTSTLNVKPSNTSSNNSKLKSLEVSSGILTPEFSSDNLEYSVEVQSNVEELPITAITEDADSVVALTGNKSLSTGDNKVEITITAADNITKRTYTINVKKLETGVSPQTVSNIDGTRLASKAMYITVMQFPEDAQIPKGYVKSALVSNGVQTDAWLLSGSTTDSDIEYYIVYGRAQNGDIGYYCYDNKNETLQRYFESPMTMEVNNLTNENNDLKNENNTITQKYKIMLIVIAVLGLLVIILLISLIITNKSHNKNKSIYDDHENYDDEFDDMPKKGKSNKFDYEDEPFDRDYEDNDNDNDDDYSFIKRRESNRDADSYDYQNDKDTDLEPEVEDLE